MEKVDLPILDLSMVKIAQDKNKEKNKTEKQLFEEKEQAFFDDEMEEIEKRFLEFCIKTDDEKKKQQVYGELYVSKENKQKIKDRITIALKIAAGIMLLYTAVKANDIYETVSMYNNVVDTKMQNELTEENVNAYNYDHDRPLIDGLRDYSNIKEIEDELMDSDNYDFMGNATIDTGIEYMKFDEDALYNMPEVRQSAIDIYADQVVEEYSSHMRRGN